MIIYLTCEIPHRGSLQRHQSSIGVTQAISGHLIHQSQVQKGGVVKKDVLNSRLNIKTHIA